MTWGQIGVCLGAAAGFGIGAAVGIAWTGGLEAVALLRMGRWLAMPVVAALGAIVGKATEREHGAANGALAGLVLGFAFGDPVVQELAAWSAAVLGGAIGAAVLAPVGYQLMSARGRDHYDRRLPGSVAAEGALARDRLEELDAARGRIDQLRRRVATQVATQHRDAALDAIQAAEEAHSAQRARYVVQTWRVELARWQNRLQPTLAGWRRFGDVDCERHLRVVDTALLEASQMLRAWSTADAARSPAGQRALETLTRLGAAGQHLRQALLLRQAVAVAAASPGVDEAFATRDLSADAAEQLDLLGHHAELIDFSCDSREISNAAGRVRADLDAIREVEALVANIEE